ncbi:hypothetical protein [Erwinia sp. JUb26]|uniref:hypothetical protein n=1 Tax=Erwinia sp. JUb26 TaxID=2485126 RepID=UPI000FBA4997|nr:hypothetical protein [Erwinia sp. JUb26]ROR09884.1 hypothetical protein EC836_104136 [Erwinia sp. JUb26]
MPVELNTIPGPAWRPSAPKPLRWLGALPGFFVAGSLLAHYQGLQPEENVFWWFAIGSAVFLWLIIASVRLLFYLMQQSYSNGYDQARERDILQMVRRGRRALQILAAECITAHSVDMEFTDIADALLTNENKITAQPSWNGALNIRHSRLPDLSGMPTDIRILAIFSRLLEKLAVPLSQLPSDYPVTVLLESSSSHSATRIRELWQQAWRDRFLSQPAFLTEGKGLEAIDLWLDHRIKDKSLLLVVALQIAPEETEMSGECVVGLLFGNRLTQTKLTPFALLHRPERSDAQQASLQSGVLQAANWVPMLDNEIEHLWLAGLPAESEACRSAIVVQGKAPLSSVSACANVHNFNAFLGDLGCANPWLGICAAAQAASLAPTHHMIISAEQGRDAVWSSVVAPIVTGQ